MAVAVVVRATEVGVVWELEADEVVVIGRSELCQFS